MLRLSDLAPGRLSVLILAWYFLLPTVPRAAGGPAWEQHEGYRVARLAVPAGARTGFTLLSPAETGLWFTNQLSYPSSVTNQNLLNGAGVCAGDMDQDGLPDLYFCNLEGRNALFRNLGQGRFEDITVAAGVGCEHQSSRGAVFADIDGDGDLDLIVTSISGPNACLLNDGHGRFKDITQEAGLVLMHAGSESMALGDLDGDGALDLYITNDGENSIMRGGGSISMRMVNGKPVITGRAGQRLRIVEGQLIELGVADALYRNDGRGRFRPWSWTDGSFLMENGQPLKEAPRDLGLSVAIRDLNGDGAPDLFVCNDFQTPDRIWLNDGRGHFQAMPDLAVRTTSLFSMCVDFADLDRDGRDDFITHDMLSRLHRLRVTQTGGTNPSPAQLGETVDRQQARRNALHFQRGDGTFEDVANFAGVDASDWTWGVAFLDVDLDGFEDVLTVNGHAYDTQDLDMREKETPTAGAAPSMRGGKELKDYPPLPTPNYLFRNLGNRTFQEVGAAWGYHASNICHGISLADLDNDGDLDVVVSCLWAPPLVYRNDSTAPRLAVRLRGLAPNTQGIGAKIVVRGGAVPEQHQEMQCGGRYLSADQAERVFAAGSRTNQLSIEVRWRSGRRSLVSSAAPNCLYEIDEAASVPAALEKPVQPAPVFADISERVGHVHEDPPFNDLERQPLLPKLLSRQGPGVAWLDLDGDGREELVMGAGRGGRLAVFQSDGQGRFTRWGKPPWQHPAPDDLAGLVGWTPEPGKTVLLAGVSHYESEPGESPAVWRYEVGGGERPQVAVTAGAADASPGPLAVADVNGDGWLDLFVGGRVIPGQYPVAASSRLYLNRGGRLELDQANAGVLRQVGLASGAVFTDLNGDGWPDLVVACEWGPLRIFLNTAGQLREATREWGLSNDTGWWSGVTAGDLDGDGRPDLIAGNWGLNSGYHQPSPRQPVRWYYGDFDDNGTLDLLETEFDEETGLRAPRRDLAFLSAGWPLLRSGFATHRQYATSALDTVLGEQAGKAKWVEAATLASMVWMNRGDHFEAVPLPTEAQMAPVFGVAVADMDGDGNEDVFLSQNFFAMRAEEPRLDAGRGLWLRGDGAGGLTPVEGHLSGVRVYGEQRGAALADFDGDGRVDLAVAQNSGATKLFQNVGAKPGLRVRLAGPPGNPSAVGAQVRLKFGEKLGPLREIHAGSGYWSQDSVVQVLGTPAEPAQIWVRWPGGKVTVSEVPAGARSIQVDTAGVVSQPSH